jgi:hypothetical protein
LLKLKETTLSEIIRVVPHDMIKDFRSRGYAQDAADFLVESILNGSEASEENDAVSENTFHVSNPETEKPIMDLMKEKYENLKAKTDDASGTVSSSLFKEFITSSFYQICEKYRCKTVTFNIENKNGKTEISVMPNS